MKLVISIDYGPDLPAVSATLDGEPVRVSESARSLIYDLCFRMDHGTATMARFVSVGEYSPVDFTGPWDD